MIRKARQSDLERMLDIWLNASVRAHAFTGKDFWHSRLDDMRDKYLPAAENYVYEDDSSETVKGFLSLYGDDLAALFVSPDSQGLGIGSKLLNKAKTLRTKLTLTVYKENPKATRFYIRHGFKTVREQTDSHSGRIELLMSFPS